VRDVIRRRISKQATLRFIGSLRDTVQGLEWRPAGTAWANYASDHSYSDEAFESKRRLVREYVAAAAPRTVWDLGGNTGTFSRIAREVAELVICFDADPAAVESNYREVRARKETGVLPLQMDLMNPSPGSGWAHEERLRLERRVTGGVAAERDMED
jgi:hypothetical protein